MAIVRQYPWFTLNQLQEEMNRLFERAAPEAESGSVATAEWTPAVDIREDQDRFVLLADIPGVDPQGYRYHHGKGCTQYPW